MPIRVLIAEDDTATRAALVMLLQGEGYTADSVSDGRAALAYLRSGAPAPHLIILDLMMPVMDGESFMEALQHHPRAALHDVPVAILTASRQRSTTPSNSPASAGFGERGRPPASADRGRRARRWR